MILSPYLRRLIPFLVCLYLIVFSQIPSIRLIFVPILFIPIFYFSIFNPVLLNSYMVFFLGVFADLLTQTPFGLFSFVFVLLFFIGRLNRLFLKEMSFKNLWILFGICSGFLLLLELFVFTILVGTVVQTRFLFQEYIVLILFYPLGFLLCAQCQKWIGEDD